MLWYLVALFASLIIIKLSLVCTAGRSYSIRSATFMGFKDCFDYGILKIGPRLEFLLWPSFALTFGTIDGPITSLAYYTG